MRMHMRVADRRDVVHGCGNIEQRSLQWTRRHCRGGLRQHREEERERMRADADATADEQEGDQACADCLKLSEPEWVSSTRRPTG